MNSTINEQCVREAVAKAQWQGWSIKSSVTFDPVRKVCCPLGAMLIGRSACKNPLQAAAGELGVDVVAAFSFANAFDGGRTSGIFAADAELGRMFRREILEAGK